MQAREYFEGVRSAALMAAGARARLDAMRAREGVRAQGYGPTAHGGGSDAMAATDERIDAEARVRREMAGFLEQVEGGRAVCAGVRAANPRHPRWADVLEIRFCEASTWSLAASALGVSVSQARADCSAACEWIDSVGLAAAREGKGRASD